MNQHNETETPQFKFIEVDANTLQVFATAPAIVNWSYLACECEELAAFARETLGALKVAFVASYDAKTGEHMTYADCEGDVLRGIIKVYENPDQYPDTYEALAWLNSLQSCE